MCRFLVYKGGPARIGEGLIRPENSLIKQSYHAREMSEPLNGDGFGLAWYTPGSDPTPCLFTSVAPAWSNRNLRRLAVRIATPCYFAHVRAATPGSTVNEQNCHPFRYGRFSWMHNGRIAGFPRIMRAMRRSLRDDLYWHVRGTTDSELIFYRFLQNLTVARESVRRELTANPEQIRTYKRDCYDLLQDAEPPETDEELFVDRMVEHLGEFEPETLRDALLTTLRELSALTAEAGIEEASFYNLAVSDGRTVMITRFSDRADAEPPSLYSSTGLRHGAADEPAIFVASEPLTELHDDWEEVPADHMLLIRPDWECELLPID